MKLGSSKYPREVTRKALLAVNSKPRVKLPVELVSASAALSTTPYALGVKPKIGVFAAAGCWEKRGVARLQASMA